MASTFNRNISCEGKDICYTKLKDVKPGIVTNVITIVRFVSEIKKSRDYYVNMSIIDDSLPANDLDFRKIKCCLFSSTMEPLRHLSKGNIIRLHGIKFVRLYDQTRGQNTPSLNWSLFSCNSGFSTDPFFSSDVLVKPNPMASKIILALRDFYNIHGDNIFEEKENGYLKSSLDMAASADVTHPLNVNTPATTNTSTASCSLINNQLTTTPTINPPMHEHAATERGNIAKEANRVDSLSHGQESLIPSCSKTLTENLHRNVPGVGGASLDTAMDCLLPGRHLANVTVSRATAGSSRRSDNVAATHGAWIDRDDARRGGFDSEQADSRPDVIKSASTKAASACASIEVVKDTTASENCENEMREPPAVTVMREKSEDSLKRKMSAISDVGANLRKNVKERRIDGDEGLYRDDKGEGESLDDLIPPMHHNDTDMQDLKMVLQSNVWEDEISSKDFKAVIYTFFSSNSIKNKKKFKNRSEHSLINLSTTHNILRNNNINQQMLINKINQSSLNTSTIENIMSINVTPNELIITGTNKNIIPNDVTINKLIDNSTIANIIPNITPNKLINTETNTNRMPNNVTSNKLIDTRNDENIILNNATSNNLINTSTNQNIMFNNASSNILIGTSTNKNIISNKATLKKLIDTSTNVDILLNNATPSKLINMSTNENILSNDATQNKLINITINTNIIQDNVTPNALLDTSINPNTVPNNTTPNILISTKTIEITTPNNAISNNLLDSGTIATKKIPTNTTQDNLINNINQSNLEISQDGVTCESFQPILAEDNLNKPDCSEQSADAIQITKLPEHDITNQVESLAEAGISANIETPKKSCDVSVLEKNVCLNDESSKATGSFIRQSEPMESDASVALDKKLFISDRSNHLIENDDMISPSEIDATMLSKEKIVSEIASEVLNCESNALDANKNNLFKIPSSDNFIFKVKSVDKKSNRYSRLSPLAKSTETVGRSCTNIEVKTCQSIDDAIRDEETHQTATKNLQLKYLVDEVKLRRARSLNLSCPDKVQKLANAKTQNFKNNTVLSQTLAIDNSNHFENNDTQMKNNEPVKYIVPEETKSLNQSDPQIMGEISKARTLTEKESDALQIIKVIFVGVNRGFNTDVISDLLRQNVEIYKENFISNKIDVIIADYTKKKKVPTATLR